MNCNIIYLCIYLFVYLFTFFIKNQWFMQKDFLESW